MPSCCLCAEGPRHLATLQRLYEARDGRRLALLVKAMAGAKGGEAVFETWMRQESDAVQACARAYGEREVLGACLRQLEQVWGFTRSVQAPVPDRHMCKQHGQSTQASTEHTASCTLCCASCDVSCGEREVLGAWMRQPKQVRVTS